MCFSHRLAFLHRTWCILLSAIAFLPVAKSSPTMSVFESLLTASEDQLSLSDIRGRLDSMNDTDGHLYPKLLLHILKLLDCCHPYETREVPFEAVTSMERRLHASGGVGERPSTFEANFATQMWLSLVNCLQVRVRFYDLHRNAWFIIHKNILFAFYAPKASSMFVMATFVRTF